MDIWLTKDGSKCTNHRITERNWRSGTSDQEKNKKSPRSIRPCCCSPSPWGVKYVTVTQDKSPCLCSERHKEYLFGQAKTRGLEQVTIKKIIMKKKTGITRPCPNGRVTKKRFVLLVVTNTEYQYCPPGGHSWETQPKMSSLSGPLQ